MSNKTQLQTNNTNLASYTDRVSALIDVANSLPEAGGSGGGSDETYSITINVIEYEMSPDFFAIGKNKNGNFFDNITTVTWTGSIFKNSIFAVSNVQIMMFECSNANLTHRLGSQLYFEITGDSVIDLYLQ